MLRHLYRHLDRLNCQHPFQRCCTSLPLPPTGEQDAIGCPSDAFGMSGTTVLLGWVDNTLAQSFRALMPLHAPCSSVPFGGMGGECTPTAWPTMPLEGATQSGCLMCLARPSCQLNSVAIAKGAAHASATTTKVFKYWDATVSPYKQALYWEQDAGPPLTKRLLVLIKERLLVNAQSGNRHAQWVRTHLAMSVSPSHPHHLMGRSPGLMAPSPAVHQVSSPLTSTAHPPAPAHLTKTAP
jgi:hypothetical protein